jgi:hypothetical protein
MLGIKLDLLLLTTKVYKVLNIDLEEEDNLEET